MSKQPTYVWVVYEDASDAAGSKGIVAVYARRADAVKRVRQLRRECCRPEVVDEWDGQEAILLKDWHVTDQPDCFSVHLITHTAIEFEARRMEVQK